MLLVGLSGLFIIFFAVSLFSKAKIPISVFNLINFERIQLKITEILKLYKTIVIEAILYQLLIGLRNRNRNPEETAIDDDEEMKRLQ